MLKSYKMPGVSALAVGVAMLSISAGAAAQAAPATAAGEPRSSTEVGAQNDQPSVAAGPASSTATNVAPAQAVGAPADAVAAGDIIVTGTRRATRLQDTPVAITAVSDATIKNAGYTAPSDLQYLVPSLTFNPQVGAGFFLRGFGSQGFDYNLEKSVGVIVDDVVQGLPRSIGFNTFADIERVEVLKGPQGTLFGKNTSAGAVFVVTRKPQYGETEALSSIQYGTDNEIKADATYNIPLAENVAARITGAFQRRDGYVDNRFDGSKVGGYRDYSVRAKLLAEIMPDLESYTLIEYQDHQDSGANIHETVRSFVPGANPVPANSATLLDYDALLANPYGIVFGSNNKSIAENSPYDIFIRQKGAQETLAYKIREYTVTSVTAFKSQSSGNSSDGDYSPLNFNTLNIGRLTAHQFSQEVRLNSPVGGFLDYVVGAYFFDQRVRATEAQGGNSNQNLPANTFISPVGGLGNYTARSRSYAAFGQANGHMTDKLTLILGGRFTHDAVGSSYFPSASPYYNFTGTVIPATSGSDTKNNVSGKVTLQYQPNSLINMYATYARGYKAPAIASSRGVLVHVKPEFVDDFEGGIKTQLLDRRLTLNLSAFYEKFKNFQTTTFIFLSDGNFQQVLANAPGLDSKGIEAEASLRVGGELTLSGNIAYNPTRYKGFLTSCYRGQPVSTVAAPGNCYALNGRNVYNVEGFQNIFAPKTTFNVAADYSRPMSDRMDLFANANYSHRSGAYTVAGDANTIQPAYGLLNASLGLGATNGSVRASVFARNLLDKSFIVRLRSLPYSGAGSYMQTQSNEGQRTIGVRVEFAL